MLQLGPAETSAQQRDCRSCSEVSLHLLCLWNCPNNLSNFTRHKVLTEQNNVLHQHLINVSSQATCICQAADSAVAMCYVTVGMVAQCELSHLQGCCTKGLGLYQMSQGNL